MSNITKGIKMRKAKTNRSEKKPNRPIPKPEDQTGSSSTPDRASTSHAMSSNNVLTKSKDKNKNESKGELSFYKQENMVRVIRELLKVSHHMETCDGKNCPFDEGPEEYDDGKLYTCPEISDEVLTREEWSYKIQDYIILVNESDPLLSAILAIKSLNPKEKADECLSVITRYLKNIIENPQNDKYRRIKCQNPVFESKVLSADGAMMFFGVVGFQLEGENEHETCFAFYESHHHLKEVIRMINSVDGFQLIPFEPKEDTEEGVNCTDGSPEDDKIYKLTSADLKKNQQLRALEIEKEKQLRTKSMREKEKMLVPKSKDTKIRVRTPEGTLLETTFQISDKLSVVYQYVDQELANGRQYSLMMPPATPFKDTDKDRTLANLQLFPAVLLTLKWAQVENKPKKQNKVKK